MKKKRSLWSMLSTVFSAVIIALASGGACAQRAITPPQPVDNVTGHPRAVIVSDIGNEPDDQMSFVRLLLYSNEIDLEAMIATTSTWQRTATHPETMHAIIKTYGQVRTNLLLHAKGWPTAEDLDSRVFAGQPAYGMAATGQGRASAGSRALAQAIERNDDRPLWVCTWGGTNTLAQALIDLRAAHAPEEMGKLVSRLRVYSISDQDDAGQWIRSEFPSLFYIVMPSPQNGEEYYYATWTGISGDIYYRNGAGADTSLVTNEWLDKNIRSRGPLGQLYPRFMFIMEGDTPSFLGLIDNGLNAYRRPDWGGWGGRYVYRQPHGETHSIWSQGGDMFTRASSQDVVRGVDGQEHVSDQATIWRWREAYQDDFAARMDWTVKDFAHANHNPMLVVNGQPGTAPIEIEADAGQSISLDAAGSSDPDGQLLHYKWWVYPEAGLTGTHGAAVTIAEQDKQQAKVTVNSPCRELWIPGLIPCRGEGVAHIILEVTDEGSPRLTSYRRVLLHVRPLSQK
ncbi:MAG TPA: nucleoside hydrolase-like domain-containing protein [Terracidiphilus sp.]|nr:nucleoside hydrolase-like domain-containing protein [Terracidiphilus sp.]